MAELRDLRALRKQRELRRTERDHNDSGARLDFSTAAKEQAHFRTLPEATIDGQLYAVTEDYVPDPGTGERVRGFHVLKFAPEVKTSDALSYLLPTGYRFMPFEGFHERFASRGEILQHGIFHMLEKFDVTLGDPRALTEIFRRNVEKVEYVVSAGLYNTTDPDLRFAVRQDEYIVTPVGGFPDVLTRDEASQRLMQRDGNRWRGIHDRFFN